MTKEEFDLALPKLTEPFKNPKWRILSYYPKNAPTKCIVAPYLDARMVQERLDSSLGASNWQNTYDPETGSSSISILVDGEWVTKSDVGVESFSDKEKGKASDAFKRAAVMWGVGRDIYKIGEKWLACKDKKPITSKGEILYTPAMISNYMNKISESAGLMFQLWNMKKELQQDSNFIELFKELKVYYKED